MAKKNFSRKMDLSIKISALALIVAVIALALVIMPNAVPGSTAQFAAGSTATYGGLNSCQVQATWWNNPSTGQVSKFNTCNARCSNLGKTCILAQFQASSNFRIRGCDFSWTNAPLLCYCC